MVSLPRGHVGVATSATRGDAPAALFNEAVRLFFAAQPVESAKVFDQLVAARPESEPELWQRGLALYYAGRFDDGRRQFELHRTVNPADVENVAWHFACVARDQGVDALIAPARGPPTDWVELVQAHFRTRRDSDVAPRAARDRHPLAVMADATSRLMPG